MAFVFFYLEKNYDILKSKNPCEFEKWCAIRASVGGVGSVLVWVACLGGSVGGALARMECESVSRGWPACMSSVLASLGC